MARLIQSKQIEGVVTASVIQGDFQSTGAVTASAISASRILGVQYNDITGTPNFIGGSGITITQVGDTYTFTNTGGSGVVVSGSSDGVSTLYLNAYTASNDLIIQGIEATTASLQTQITSLSSSLSNLNTGVSDFTQLTGVPLGLVSASIQILGGSDVVSGSVLRTLEGTNVLSASVTFEQFSASLATEFQNIQHTQIPQGTISSSQQISDLGFVTSSDSVTLPSGLISSSQQLIDLGFSTTDNTGSDTQSLTIVGDQLTISGGNTITIPTGSSGVDLPSGLVSSSDQILGGSGILSGSHTDISSLNTFTESIQSQVDSLRASTGSYLTSETDNQTLTIVGDQLTISDGNTITIPTGSGGGVSSWNDLTDIPSGLVSGSVLRTLDGTDVLSGSVLTDLSASITTTIQNIQHTSIPSGVISGSTFTDFSSSVHNEIQSIQHTDISSLNDYTSSTDVRLSNLESNTSSLQSQINSLVSATGSYITSETDSQNLSIVGNQLTISNGNTITIPTGSDLPSGLISSSEQILGGSDIVSGSVLRTLDGTGILSGSKTDITQLNEFTASYLTDSASFDSRIDNIVVGESSFNGDRAVSNTLLGDLYTNSYNAGTSGSLSEFIEQIFFPSYAPTATFVSQTANWNENLAVGNSTIELFTITDTDSDTPYQATISGTNGSLFNLVPQNVNSSSWEIQPKSDLSAGSYSYDITITDSNNDSRDYSGRSVTITQAEGGTLTTTGTLYIIESAQSGPIYLGTNGRGGSQGRVSVSYSPNYGSQVATNFQSSNSLIGVNSSTGLLSVNDPINGSGNVSGDTITSTISWEDQYGNISTEDISVNVTQNNAPDIIFTNSSRLNTNQAVSGGGTLVTISFSDTEGDSINHDSFQFTDTSGQLTTTKSGNNYLVTANSNLSGSTSYTIGATIEDTHGFRSNTESHSFTIVQSGIGTLNGDSTVYIIESALTNNSFRDATGFGNGNTAQVGVNYSPSAGSQTVQSFSSSNPSILIDSSGNLTLGVDISGSVTQSGDTFSTTITFQDQYGNIGSGSVTANVFGNNAPSVTFASTSQYDTDGSTAGSTAGTITISDTETNSPYNVSLSGTNGNLFQAVPQNAISSSWLVQPINNITAADTYSIDITTTDNYGETSTLSNKLIVVDDVSSGETVYVYSNNLGPVGSWNDGTYNGVMGIGSTNGDTPPGVVSYTTPTSTLSIISTNDVLGDSTISTNGGSGTLTLVETLTNVTDLDTALANAGSINVSSAHQYIIFYPQSDNLTTPTSIQQSINGTSGGVVPYFNADGAGWGIESAGLNRIYIDTAHQGYNNWFVLGRKGTNPTSSNVQIRLINANGGTSPT